MPPRETIDLRELVRHRANLVRERTRLKALFLPRETKALRRKFVVLAELREPS